MITFPFRIRAAEQFLQEWIDSEHGHWEDCGSPERGSVEYLDGGDGDPVGHEHIVNVLDRDDKFLVLHSEAELVDAWSTLQYGTTYIHMPVATVKMREKLEVMLTELGYEPDAESGTYKKG